MTAPISWGDFLISGFWPDRETSGAADSPVIVHSDDGRQDTTLIGIESTFRGHPENTFRPIGNALFGGVD